MARIEVGFTRKDGFGEHIKAAIRNDLNIAVQSVRTADVYVIDLTAKEAGRVARELLTDKITQSYSDAFFSDYDWLVEVGFLEGVTDNAAQATAEGIADILGKKPHVKTAKAYAIKGKLPEAQVKIICEKLLANTLIQYYTIKRQSKVKGA